MRIQAFQVIIRRVVGNDDFKIRMVELHRVLDNNGEQRWSILGRNNDGELHELMTAAAPNFKLVSPSRMLSPPEHFEFALDFATGDYVAYLSDKMVVLPHALSDVDATIRTSKADIVNWSYAQFAIDDSENPFGSGSLTFELEFLNGQPKSYDPIAALRFKASCGVPREQQRVRDYALGKIVFGCFSKELIDRIRSTSGTVFGGATHDYSAMVQGLSLARTCVMLNKYEILFIALPSGLQANDQQLEQGRHARQRACSPLLS